MGVIHTQRGDDIQPAAVCMSWLLRGASSSNFSNLGEARHFFKMNVLFLFRGRGDLFAAAGGGLSLNPSSWIVFVKKKRTHTSFRDDATHRTIYSQTTTRLTFA